MVPINLPFLPPKEEYDKYTSQIWERQWLTNNGPLVIELELKLKEYLHIDHLLYVTNGTMALQIAIKALELKGEIITTPFSYVATTSSIVWEGCTPIFADIDKDTLNIDPKQIETKISKDTCAILATHVYGNPCDIDAIDSIAKKHKLKVIYDAAHCFGSTYKGKSVYTYGDISTASFHATKVFHTTEGGALITHDPELIKRLAYLRNFGHDGPNNFNGIGINGKNSEFHAAMGLANFPYINKILLKRKTDHLRYQYWLDRIKLQQIKFDENLGSNFSYYPIILKNEAECLLIFQTLEANQIFCRRYFYPLLSNLDYVVSDELPIAENYAKRVLCLPLYYQISPSEIDLICSLILKTIE
jgi:dTDP-4-amino-4,6-dideoxygalactose transaminase